MHSLVIKAKELARKEREIGLQVIRCIREIKVRGIHLEMGYGSLFEFIVSELNYSDGAAYRRIEAMKLLEELPEIEEKVVIGELNLTNLSLIQTTSKTIKISRKEKKELLEKVVFKSTREAEKLINQFKEKKTGIKEKRIIKIEITEELEEKIRLLRAHSHKLSNGSDQEFFETMIEILTDKLKIETTSAPKLETKKIPKKQTLMKAAQHRCQYIDPKTKRRCLNERFLQIDHKIPKSKNGSSQIENLQVLCSNHNQWKSDRVLYGT